MTEISTSAVVAWSRRLDDLKTQLTGEDWARLRLELRQECANHSKTELLYAAADDCPHDVGRDEDGVPVEVDELHVWSDDIDALICLETVVEHACLCQDGGCSQLGSAREAHDDLWVDVSYEHRRRQRAAHLFPAVMDAWLNTALDLETAEELAYRCLNTAQYQVRVANALEKRGLDR